MNTEYLEAFNGKEQLIFYGQDNNDLPLILSYKTEVNLDQIEQLKAILRTKEKNFCMTIPLAGLVAGNSENTEHITPNLVCKAISPDLKAKFFYPLVDLNVKCIFLTNFKFNKILFTYIYIIKGF